MFKAKENFKVYIDSKLHEIKEGEMVPCGEELGMHLVNTQRCDLVEQKPIQEVKIEAPVEKKIEEPVKKPARRGRRKASDK